jgi:hypothetical protein
LPMRRRGTRTEDWDCRFGAKLGEEVLPMSRAKRKGRTMPVLGAAGLLALASGASAEAPEREADAKHQIEPATLFG